MGSDGAIAALGEHLLSPVVRLAGCAMVLSVAGRLLGAAEGRLLGRLERDSLGIYLFHQQIVQVVLFFMNAPAVPPLLAASVAFELSLVVSDAIVVVLRRFKLGRAMLGGL